jgi:hypothetical protein
MRLGAPLALLLLAAACSSDDAELPQAGVETPGAFVAEELDSGNVRLFRTLAVYAFDGFNKVLLVTLYKPDVASFE